MEDNVALDSTKQKQFVKSIKGIKKILKVKGNKKPDKNAVKIGKVKKPRRKERGLVYLSHIPHGFYEHQMTEYFKQFGVVTNARVIRSKRTGMSKGHAFVEFKDPNVAEVVAETMNNYLMGKRLIKAEIVPAEKQRKFAKRKHWNAQNNPGNDLRQRMKKAHNSVKDESQEFQTAKRLLSNLNKTKKKLSALGIDYDFFTPVDIPESLLSTVNVETVVNVGTTGVMKKEIKNKIKEESSQDDKHIKGKKISVVDAKTEDSTEIKQANKQANKKSKKSKSKEIQQANEKTNFVKLDPAPEVSEENKKGVKVTKTDKKLVKDPKNKDGKQKPVKPEKEDAISKIQKQKLKNTENKLSANFIKILMGSDNESESDSSVNFDSDEYNKVIEQGDSDVESGETDEELDEEDISVEDIRFEHNQGGSDVESDETDEDLDEEVTSDEDISAEDEPTPPKKSKANISKVQALKNKPQMTKLNKGKKPLAPQPVKQVLQKEAKTSKTPKFEKKNKKTFNKVIKKKK